MVVLACCGLVVACQSSPQSAYRDGQIVRSLEKAGVDVEQNPGRLLAYAAEQATSEKDIALYNREYGQYLLERGKARQAHRAFDVAAAAGDRRSQSLLLAAYADKTYRPKNKKSFASAVLIPRATQQNSVSAMLILAELTGDGVLRGGQFKSEDYWLRKAAAQDSGRAQRLLAEKAERAGHIKEAANLYAKFDSLSRSERALRQARDYYLGREKPVNVRLGRAWMEQARRRDKKGAGELAARILRQTSESRDAPYLTEIALAAGITPTIRVRDVINRYRSAKTEAERQDILEPLRKAANQGNGGAALSLANVLTSVGGNKREATKYLLMAFDGGDQRALDDIIAQMLRASRGSSSGAQLLSRVERAARGGDVDAARSLTSLYSIGGLRKPNADQARRWLKIAADTGDTKSQYEYGVDLIENVATSNAKSEGRIYLERAASAGDAIAKSYLNRLN